ncbi:hypothetical protein [Streptomyces sp. NPDC055060]
MGHRTPQRLRALTCVDLVEGWVEFLRYRVGGCGSPNGCLGVGSLCVFDVDPGHYRALPVTRITHLEIHGGVAAG